MAHIGFDSTGIEPREAFDVIPAGKYTVAVSKSDIRQTQAKTGRYVWLEMDVLDGPHKGRKLWDNINFDNPNQQAVDIAQRTLSAICHAIGIVKLNDTTETHGVPMVVKVALAKKADGSDTNVVKGYMKIGDESRPAATPAKPTGNSQRPPWAAGR